MLKHNLWWKIWIEVTKWPRHPQTVWFIWSVLPRSPQNCVSMTLWRNLFCMFSRLVAVCTYFVMMLWMIRSFSVLSFVNIICDWRAAGTIHNWAISVCSPSDEAANGHGLFQTFQECKFSPLRTGIFAPCSLLHWLNQSDSKVITPSE